MKSLLSKGITKENILLAAIWGAVIITGFLALGAIVGCIEGLFVFDGIHSHKLKKWGLKVNPQKAIESLKSCW